MTRIAEGLPKELFIRAGEDLGFVKDGRTFVLDDITDGDYVLDRAIHDIRWEGRRWIERICDEDIGKYQAEEQALLKAHREPVFSLYEVMDVHSGRGMQLKDIFGGKELFLTDFGFGTTGSKDLVIATRVISHDGVNYTSGVTMIYRHERAAQMAEQFHALYREQGDTPAWKETMRTHAPALFREYRKGDMKVELTPVSNASFAPLRIRTEKVERIQQAPEEVRPYTGRNAPCPCGSGKKYKKCCLGKEKEQKTIKSPTSDPKSA